MSMGMLSSILRSSLAEPRKVWPPTPPTQLGYSNEKATLRAPRALSLIRFIIPAAPYRFIQS
ncbi:MAG: hypothetical protein JWP13_282 [Candidatus Saccharibacteria bacterium]|nr:hypothetical protein [Candidatus Saccharibacteria bacterium]